jgi:Cu2+-exporting ATPase
MSHPDLCIHCNLPIPPADLVVDEINGEELHFCCHGCQGVYRIITGAGLKKFYKSREWSEEGVPSGVYDARFDETSLASHVIQSNDTCAEIPLIIEGIRCASCVWLLEKILTREAGINAIRINYGTHRAQINFDPRETSPVKIFTAISRLGYMPHPFTSGAAQQAATREQRSLLIRFGTAAFLSMQLMGFSFALYGGYFHGIEPRIEKIIEYFAAAVATPVVFYSGWPFFSGAWRSLCNRAASMDLLISLGAGTAYCYSIFSLFTGGEVYFDTAAMIITLILLGRLLESSARNRSISGINKLLQLAPESAQKIFGDKVETVASASLHKGDKIIVKPGERIPVDCRIISGTTELDESMITGEPLPVLRQPGDELAAGTLNITTSLTLAVIRPANDSFIARIAQLVEEAQSRIAPIQSLADRVATYFVPAVTFIAAATWIFWRLNGSADANPLLNAVAVLIVACPCALGLATPTAVLAATANAANRGILFRGGDILEMTARVDTVALDKTGTLTYGRPTVKSVLPAAGYSEKELLTLACRVEAGSDHPLARSILLCCKDAGIDNATPEPVTTIPGRGLRMATDNGEILAGSRLFLEENGIAVPAVESEDLSEVYLSLNDNLYGTFLIHDPVRDDAAKTIDKLHEMGLDTILLTGDHEKTAAQVCNTLSIQDYHANMSPTDKASWVKQQQSAGHRVMMVGDGINDAPALALADIGCAMAGGTDIALETSDLVLTRPNLGRLFEAMHIARKTLRVIKQNLFWAFSYNLITIPLAASGKLAPVWAALAMATSSLFVVSNSYRLGRIVRRSFSVAKRIKSD